MPEPHPHPGRGDRRIGVGRGKPRTDLRRPRPEPRRRVGVLLVHGQLRREGLAAPLARLGRVGPRQAVARPVRHTRPADVAGAPMTSHAELVGKALDALATAERYMHTLNMLERDYVAWLTN